MHILIVGATSLIAEHCARLWLADSATRLTLVARDAAKLERVAADLRVRAQSNESTEAPAIITPVVAELLDVPTIGRVTQAAFTAAPVHVVLIAHGWLPDQHACQADLGQAEQALRINAVSPALWAEACIGALQRQGHGTLALIGSVAGDRGRAVNYVYGAAKGLLERYAEGLQQRVFGSAVRVVLIKPGPTATPMTAAMAEPPRMAAPVQAVAARIVRGIARRRAVVYAPARWALVMWVLRQLPRAVFNRLKV